MIFKQFYQMELMNYILRYRKGNGLALCIDAKKLKMEMQRDGMKILTNAKNRKMRDYYKVAAAEFSTTYK